MTMPQKWFHAVLAGWMVCAPALAADWGLDATVGIAYDDNVSNSLEVDQRKADTAVTLDLAAGLHQQINAGASLGADFIAESATSLRYGGLSYTGLGVRARWRQKFGLGAEVPWTSFAVGAVHRDFHDDNRDGWQYDADLSVGRRFGERWSLRASAHYDRYETDHIQPARIPGLSTAAYDIAGNTLRAEAAFIATEADVLAFSYSRRHGTVTAVTKPDLEVLEYSDAAVRDNVFEPGWVAYRIRAITDSLALSWSHRLGTNTALNLGYTYRRSESDPELGAYYSNNVQLSISYSR